MLEYIFFNRSPFDRFVAYVREQGVLPRPETNDDGWLVGIPEDLDDALAQRIEDYYDRMMDLDRELVEGGAEDASSYTGAGVTVNLSDGRVVYAQVDPLLLMKITECLDAGELSDFITAISDAVEHPDERTFCQRMRDRDE